MTDAWEGQVLLKRKGIDVQTGKLKNGGRILAQEIPIAAAVSDILKPVSADTEYKVFFYKPEYPEELVYTYTYADEGIWASYAPELSVLEWVSGSTCFSADGYFRVVVKETERTKDSVIFSDLFSLKRKDEVTDNRCEKTAGWKAELINQFNTQIEQCAGQQDFRIALITDSHYTTGGIWEDTFSLMKAVISRQPVDMAVHLGDFTDGMLSSEAAVMITTRMIEELRSLSPQTGLCLGNHDRNYFRGNTNVLSAKDCCRKYLKKDKLWYRMDFPERKLVFFFLDSFDPEVKERYGFSASQVHWVKKQLANISAESRIVFFSHVPPDAKIHVWSDAIRNGPKLMRILEKHQKKYENILCWIHGHNHADQVFYKYSFPVVGIGCSKLECFEEHKPEGSITPSRKRNTRTQELWDYLLIKGNRLEFIRFGAGEDRTVVSEGKKKKIDLSAQQLRAVQLTQLELLKEVDRICRKCGIHYNIIAGTMLGAVRHKGFIPWDDDADVALLRNEYERLRQAFKTELDHEKYEFQDHKVTPGYRWGYGKLRKKGTLFLREFQEDMPYDQGIFIDVFPLDNIPDSHAKRALLNFWCFCIRKALWSRVGRRAEQNPFKRFVYKSLDHFDEKTILGKLDALIGKCTDLQSDWVRILMFPTPNREYGYKRKWYQESEPVLFEGSTFPGVYDADDYLSFKFGNYMELPPESQRKTHPVTQLKLGDYENADSETKS